MIAITKKNQKLVNKAVKMLLAYNLQNDARDRADNDGDTKAFNIADRKCEALWERYHEAIELLPKREIKAIEKSFY